MRYMITANENAILIFDFLTEEVEICTPPASHHDNRANWSTLPISQVVIPSSGIETDVYPFPAGCGIDPYNYDAVLNAVHYDYIRSRRFKSLAKLSTAARWNVRVAYEGEHRFHYITTFRDDGEWVIKNEPISYGGSMPLYEFDSPIGNMSAREDDFLAYGLTLPEALAVISECEEHSA